MELIKAYLTQRGSSVKRLPPEILRMIFKLTSPSLFLLDSSITAGPYSPWCQSLSVKLSIVKVCRAWWQACIDLVYEEVVVRRASQVPTLVRTLDHANLGNLVKSIVIRCRVPLASTTLFRGDLSRIFDSCPHVTSLTYCDPFQTISVPQCGLPLAPHHIFSTITHFDCSSSVDFSSFVTLLGGCSHLERLSFHLPEIWPESLSSHLAVVRLGNLRQLRLHILMKNVVLLPKITYWTMPALRDLSIVIHAWVDEREYHHLAPAMKEFCRVHGIGLEVLDLGQRYFGIDLRGIITMCPTLRHVVLPCDWSPYNPWSGYNPLIRAPVITHPTIQWIDYWITVNYGDLDRILHPQLPPNNAAGLPALRGIRMLDSALAEVPDLPTALPPDAALGDEVVEYELPIARIRHGAGYVIRMDLIYLGESEQTDSDDSFGEDSFSEPDDTSDESSEFSDDEKYTLEPDEVSLLNPYTNLE